MKIVMYHYVQSFDPRYPYFRFLDEQDFIKQLNFFQSNFGFLEKSEWEDAVKAGEPSNLDQKVVLTFDDSLSCHFDVVYPILRDLNLWGIFYIPSYPYITKKMLDVHRIHMLCGAFTGKKLLTALKEITPDVFEQGKIEALEKLTYRNQRDLDGITHFKRLLNYYCSSELRESLLDKIANKLRFCFEIEKFYMSEKQIRELQAGGNIVGAHTVSHPVMSRLKKEQQEVEIRESFCFLKRIGIKNVKTYCHPYGEPHDYDQNTLDILQAEGVEFSFSFDDRDLQPADFTLNRQALPRYDCNKFPYGKPYEFPF